MGLNHPHKIKNQQMISREPYERLIDVCDQYPDGSNILDIISATIGTRLLDQSGESASPLFGIFDVIRWDKSNGIGGCDASYLWRDKVG